MSTEEATDLVVVTTTFANGDDARKCARLLVDEGLAACVQITPGLISVYGWEGRTNEDEEVLVTAKTTLSRVEALAERLLDMHPYDEPEFLVTPVLRASTGYGRFVRGG